MLFTIIFLEKRNYLYGWAFYGAQGHVPHVINAGFWPVTVYPYLLTREKAILFFTAVIDKEALPI
jgi:hypothetical protein